MNDLIIKSANLINPSGEISGIHDIYIKDGKICGIDEDNTKLDSPKIIDAQDCYVCPGLIDLSVRFREPGLEKEATISSESKAAVASGITTVCYMPDTQPVIDTPAQIKLVQEIFKNVDLCDVRVLGALTRELDGERLSSMSELKHAGAIALTNCFNPIKNSLVLRRIMEYASGQDMTIFYQPLNYHLANSGCVHEGEMANKLGLPGIPSAAESTAVAEAILLSKLTGVKLHLCRISCAESLTLIKNAQSQGIEVTSDVAAHQLFFDESVINDFNSEYHVIPPFRTNEDLISLREAISSEHISAICSDHQPHNEDARQAPFSSTLPGISSIEILLPLIMDLVDVGVIDMQKAIEKVTRNPALLLNIDNGVIKKGFPADLCVFKREEWILEKNNIQSAGHNNPFIGKKFSTKVKKTIRKGRVVYENK